MSKNLLSLEAKELVEEITVMQKNVDYRTLKIKGGNSVEYGFSDYKTFKELFRDFTTEKLQQMMQKQNKKNFMQ